MRSAVFPPPVGPLMIVRAPTGKRKSIGPISKTRGKSIAVVCLLSTMAVPEFHLKRAATNPIPVSRRTEGEAVDGTKEEMYGSIWSSARKASMRWAATRRRETSTTWRRQGGQRTSFDG